MLGQSRSGTFRGVTHARISLLGCISHCSDRDLGGTHFIFAIAVWNGAVARADSAGLRAESKAGMFCADTGNTRLYVTVGDSREALPRLKRCSLGSCACPPSQRASYQERRRGVSLRFPRYGLRNGYCGRNPARVTPEGWRLLRAVAGRSHRPSLGIHP